MVSQEPEDEMQKDSLADYFVDTSKACRYLMVAPPSGPLAELLRPLFFGGRRELWYDGSCINKMIGVWLGTGQHSVMVCLTDDPTIVAKADLQVGLAGSPMSLPTHLALTRGQLGDRAALLGAFDQLVDDMISRRSRATHPSAPDSDVPYRDDVPGFARNVAVG